MGLTTGSHFGDRLDQPAARTGDLPEGAFHRGAGDPLTAVAFVNEDARDPPVRTHRLALLVGPAVLEHKVIAATVLAPALGAAVLVDDKGLVDPAGVDQFMLKRARIIETAPEPPGRALEQAPATAEALSAVRSSA